MTHRKWYVSADTVKLTGPGYANLGAVVWYVSVLQTSIPASVKGHPDMDVFCGECCSDQYWDTLQSLWVPMGPCGFEESDATRQL